MLQSNDLICSSLRNEHHGCDRERGGLESPTPAWGLAQAYTFSDMGELPRPGAAEGQGIEPYRPTTTAHAIVYYR